MAWQEGRDSARTSVQGGRRGAEQQAPGLPAAMKAGLKWLVAEAGWQSQQQPPQLDHFWLAVLRNLQATVSLFQWNLHPCFLLWQAVSLARCSICPGQAGAGNHYALGIHLAPCLVQLRQETCQEAEGEMKCLDAWALANVAQGACLQIAGAAGVVGDVPDAQVVAAEHVAGEMVWGSGGPGPVVQPVLQVLTASWLYHHAAATSCEPPASGLAPAVTTHTWHANLLILMQ